MPRDSTDRAIERRLSEADDDSARYVDLQLDLETDGGEALVGTGGRWDRRRQGYVGDAPRGRRVQCHPGQEAPARWFAGWLARWWRHRFGDDPIPEEERIYSLILAGGQRSGKTLLGVWLAVIYAIMVPRSIVWIVCPTEGDFEEVADYLRDLMPSDWYDRLGFPWWRYSLVNGSKIVLRSGHKPETLKKGDCDFLVVNEAQQQDERVSNLARLRIARSGALVVYCANPPEQPVGYWVGDRVAAAERGEIQAAYFHIDPMDNRHIDHAPLLAFAKEVDQRTFDIEVRGMFLGAKDAVFYNWHRLENEKPTPPAELEVTRDFLRSQEGRAYDRAIGIDLQRRPMVGVEFRWFWNPLVPRGHEDWCRWMFMWATREFVLDMADEEDLAIAFLDAGCDPRETLLVTDASSDWQRVKEGKQGREFREFRNEEWRGRGGWDIFRDYGFHHLVKPDRRQAGNPDIVERFRAATSRICLSAPSAYGQRYVYSDPANRKLNEAIRGYPNKDGIPARKHKHAHLSDGFTYPIVRFYPRRRVQHGPSVRVLKRFEGRRRTAGW